jgi:hypothetical protein
VIKLWSLHFSSLSLDRVCAASYLVGNVSEFNKVHGRTGIKSHGTSVVIFFTQFPTLLNC